MAEPRYIVVVGASAGGLNSVIELSAQLRPEMNIAVFIVMHLTPDSISDILMQRIQRNSSFTCKIAEHEDEINTNHLYMARPDHHLVVKKGKIILGEGPTENRWRPSIDVLFRSAAAAYDGRTIGVILSGLLQDGTAGMMAIKRCGGTLIVQDPNEAEYPDMPQSVLDNMEVDYCVSLEQMGTILLEKSKNGIPQHEVPADIIAEAAIAEKAAIGMENLAPLGEHSVFTCPDCGGALWQMNGNGVTRYRCYTGHAYTADELLLKQQQELEGTFWVALRMMEERRNLLRKMAEEEKSKGYAKSAAHKKLREQELQEHIDRLKQLLFDSKKD